MKTCTKCGVAKPLADYVGHKGSCRSCRNEYHKRWVAANPEEKRGYVQKWLAANRQQDYARRELWRRKQRAASHGLAWDEYLRRSALGCELCGAERGSSDGRALSLDHDHKTGRFRGFLCGPCNLGIGKLGDSPSRLRAAADYLERGAAPVQPAVLLRAA